MVRANNHRIKSSRRSRPKRDRYTSDPTGRYALGEAVRLSSRLTIQRSKPFEVEFRRDRKKFPTLLFMTAHSLFLMRYVKSVSIPPELAKKIEAIPNFSAYVCSMIADENLSRMTVRVEAQKRRIKALEQTLRDLANADQRKTRKAYIRNVMDTINERHSNIWDDEE